MAVTIRNIDGSTIWNPSLNPQSVRISYDNGTTEVGTVLSAVDEWLTGFAIFTATGTTVTCTVLNNAQPGAATVPATGTLKLYDSSATATESLAYSSWSWDAVNSRIVFTTSATITGTYSDATLDRCAISGGYGDTGWNTVGVSSTTVRSYKSLNVGGTVGLGGTHYKWMMLDVATAGSFFCKVYNSITGTTGTNISYASDLAGQSERFNAAAAGEIYCSAGLRHFTMLSVYGTVTVGASTSGGCAGVVELQRGHPLWALSTSTGVRTPWISVQGNQSNTIYTPPVDFFNTASGSTYYCQSYTSFGGGTTYPTNSVDPLTGKTRVSDIRLIQCSAASTNNTDTGLYYTVKLVAGGLYLDEITITVDSNGFVDPNGTAKTFLLFPAYLGRMLAVPK